MRADLLFHPDAHWKEFYEQISVLNDKEPKVWSSITKSPAPWINMVQLKAMYGPSSKKGGGNGKVDVGDACCLVA